MSKICWTYFICLIANSISAQYGTLDPTFGKDGLVRTWFKPWYVEGNDMLLLPDGKILVAGSVVDSISRMAVWRYLANGDLDTSFGNQGMATMPNQPNNTAGLAIALQRDGKILVAGENGSATPANLAVMRFLPEGKIDPSFGINGLATLDVRDGTEIAYDIKVQPDDGSIVVTGLSFEGAKPLRLLVGRFRSNGTLDTSFGDDGIILPDYGLDNAWGADVTILKDGKVLIAGTYIKNESFFVHYEYNLLMRFLPDGSPDFSFGENGRVLINFGHDARVYSMLVQPDDKILIAGPGYSNSSGFRISRFHPDGSVDTDFGEEGQALNGFGNQISSPGEMALQADGKIVVSGIAFTGYIDTLIGHHFALLRLLPNGMLDATFGQGGKITTKFEPGSFDLAYSMAIQPDHKIVLAGYSYRGVVQCISLARYNSNYDPPPVDTAALMDFIRLYPNPTPGPVTLEFWLGQETTVSLDVYDVQGRLLQNLWQPQVRPAGTFAEPLVLNDFIAAGAYFLVLTRDGRRNYMPLLKQ